MDPARLPTAVSQYWDARLRGAALSPPTAEVASQIAALEAAAPAAPAPAFVQTLEDRLLAHVTSAAAPPHTMPAASAAAVPPGRAAPARPAWPTRWQPGSSVIAAALLVALVAGLVLATGQRRAAAPIALPPAGQSTALPALASPAPSVSEAPVFLRLPAQETGFLVVPATGDEIVEVMWTAAGEALAASWDRDSAPSAGSAGPTVVTLPATWAATQAAPGDVVELISQSGVITRFLLGAPVPVAATDTAPSPALPAAIAADAGLVLVGTTSPPATGAGVPTDRVLIPATLLNTRTLAVLARPDAAACPTTTRPVSDLNASVARLQAELTGDDANSSAIDESLALAPAPATASMVTGVLATESALVACLNANDARRAYALFTDAGLDSLFALMLGDLFQGPYAIAPDFSDLPAGPPQSDMTQLSLIDVPRIQALADGRILATVWIGLGESSQLLMPTGFPMVQVLAPQPDGTYLIDAIAFAPSVPPTDLAPALGSSWRWLSPTEMTIPALDLSARVIAVRIPDDVSDIPVSNPLQVGWDVRSAEIGRPENTLLIGHLDYYTIGPAVFYRLAELQPGDEIMLRSSDRLTGRYVVVSQEEIPLSLLADPTIASLILTPDPDATMLTLITEAGEFDPGASAYTGRRLVRALYVPESATPVATPIPAPAATPVS